ncbi:metal-dependent hydrolase [Halobacterium litoreum]|uniref:Metal-dependent hydrolase n=1 Tax=Halobacterium litoreum TaxID=2039234 RepID=A0ABD5NHM7_9EURY|nr:metal-dependent hydrolase [Halobacterium litoreum]UHH12247.1 metal-dependent hydrolase [Halobacterium litoreum]
MYRSGHYGVALLAYAPVLYVLASRGHVAAAAGGGALVWVLTTLPDADQNVPVIDHRGVTHTLLFAALVGAVVGGAASLVPVSAVDGVSSATLAAGAGGLAALAILAHLAADAITPMGVAFLWPLSGKRYSLGLTPADSRLWNGGLFALGVFATAAAALLATPLY